MIKKLSRHGNSLAIVIDKPILELLSIDEGTELRIRTDGKSIIIEPETKAKEINVKDLKFQTILEEITQTYEDDLKKLANN